ncbi:Zinc finger protein [Nymphaea thermarum]|nr:Zinc finger protein [Nymphaea thermarum]
MQEEDVVVMEGVLVTSLASTGTWPRSSPAAAGSSLSPTSLSSTSVLYKTEMCRSWEEMGACRYGSRCQFAHGKQELRQVLSKNKPEVSRPRVSAQGLSTLQEVEQNEEEKKIMPQSEEFEAMVDALINPNADVAFNKRRLPVFVALTDP